MGWSEVGEKLTPLERALGWSRKWPLEERLEYGRRARRLAVIPGGVLSPRRGWHYTFRDGMRAVDDYLSGRSDEYPAEAVRLYGWLLSDGVEIGGARLRFDTRNCLRICQVVTLIYALEARARKD